MVVDVRTTDVLKDERVQSFFDVLHKIGVAVTMGGTYYRNQRLVFVDLHPSEDSDHTHHLADRVSADKNWSYMREFKNGYASLESEICSLISWNSTMFFIKDLWLNSPYSTMSVGFSAPDSTEIHAILFPTWLGLEHDLSNMGRDNLTGWCECWKHCPVNLAVNFYTMFPSIDDVD